MVDDGAKDAQALHEVHRGVWCIYLYSRALFAEVRLMLFSRSGSVNQLFTWAGPENKPFAE
jgi:hypothetical protein